MEENNGLQENGVDKTRENSAEENNEQKPSIFILLLGVFFIIRGLRRLNEGELGALGIVMIVVGAANIIYFIAKRV